MLYSLLAFISGVGLLLSGVCHLLSWFHLAPPGGKAAFLLHIGIFVVWLPLVICSNQTASTPGRGNFDPLLQQLPIWARKCVFGIFVYAMINFVVFLVLTADYPKHVVPFWLELRGFSGHWMLFYTVSLAGFVGLRRLRQSVQNRL